MENASKALIIAGAILLSILIIGLGMFIYNQAYTAMSKINLNEQQVQTINSKFLNYGSEGTNINGTQAKRLCDTVMSYNRATAEDKSQYVVISAGDAFTAASAINTKELSEVNTGIQTYMNTLLAGHTYTLHFGYDNDSALITEIHLKDTKSGS